MKVAVIIQARMGSTRLPGKVMKYLGNKTILEHVVLRIKKAQGIDEIIIATSTLAPDDLICEEAARLNVVCYRGSEEDVLARYYEAAKLHHADIVVRITSDCPFMDPQLLTAMLKFFHKEKLTNKKIDYLSNCINRTFPRGLDIEIFTFIALEKAYLEATLTYEREHVTPYILHHTTLFNLQNYLNQQDFSTYRWTLDTEEDWQFMTAVYQKLCREKDFFTTQELLTLLEQEPWLVEINQKVKQKEIIMS